jgi:hypothetical protein
MTKTKQAIEDAVEKIVEHFAEFLIPFEVPEETEPLIRQAIIDCIEMFADELENGSEPKLIGMGRVVKIATTYPRVIEYYLKREITEV